MVRKYQEQNVYEALMDRFKLLFEEFDNIYISFSGGKDSGLLLNLVLDYRDQYYPGKLIGVFHQDFEAQYTVTTEYIERTFEKIKDQVEPYWVCLPMATRTALSSYEMFWYPWDDKKQELWVREMPRHEYVINLENNPIRTYRYKMHQEDLAKQFGRWYRVAHGTKKTVCLLGMRADESLQRYSGFLNKKYNYKDECWISKQFKDVWCASPLYDWSTNDIWHAYAVFGYDYNELYDLYYKAGLKPSQMRVASPFNDYSKDSLNLYRVIFIGKIPDDTDDIKSSKDIPSWKRMCYCILKNDHTCRFMGFGLTRQQQKRVDVIREKYKSLEDIEYGI